MARRTGTPPQKLTQSSASLSAAAGRDGKGTGAWTPARGRGRPAGAREGDGAGVATGGGTGDGFEGGIGEAFEDAAVIATPAARPASLNTATACTI